MGDDVNCSVIVPTYNRSSLLRHTLACLAKQADASDPFEIIVIDDGSCDDSLEAVRAHHDFIDIRYVWKPDQGFRAAEARNYGLKLARGHIVIFVDCGVLVGRNFVKAHLLEHQRSLHQSAVIGYVYGFSPDDRISAELSNKLNHTSIDSFLAEAHLSSTYLDVREFVYERCRDNINSLTAPWCLFWTCNVSAPREAVLKAGLFDETFKSWGGEDIELGYRLYLAGIRYALCRGAAAAHYPHDDKKRSQLEAFCNYRYFSRKHDVPLSVITGMEFTRN